MRSVPPKVEDQPEAAALPPQTLRRRVKASASVLVMQEAAAQVRNEANAPLLAAHHPRTKLPSKIDLKKTLKHAPSAVALGRAKQVQYAIDDACTMVASYRSNFFDWAQDHSSRSGMPQPPRFYRRGQRARLRFDSQDFTVRYDRLHLPESLGLGVIALVDRDGEPLLQPGDRLVEVRLEPCRSRQWVQVDFVLRRRPARLLPRLLLRGNLLVDLGVARLITCLDDENLLAFFLCGGLAKAILQRGAKWHAQFRRESQLGLRHGKRRAGQLAARCARQMDDLMKKVALLVVTYAQAQQLARVVVGRNVDWKQNVHLGAKQNQTFAFIPHAQLIAALRTKCARAGLEFIETEESYTSKTDHLAQEAMGPKPEGYRWLGSRCTRGSFRSSVGLTLQADVNGCIGLGRKVGGEEWLAEFRQKLGASPGTRLVPRKVQVNGVGPESRPAAGIRHPHLLSPRTWRNTQVALAKAGLVPDLPRVAVATHNPQVFPIAA
jgi:IS605 OrfB family transposase